MEHITDLPLEAIIRGYSLERRCFCCHFCGASFRQGEIFPREGRLFDAEAAVELHLEQEHPNRLEELFALGKKQTGLTENHRELLLQIAAGHTDREIAGRMGVAASTIRHQRFTFREKARQAKLYLAIYDLAFRSPQRRPGEEILPLHKGARMVDERYATTADEENKVLETMFASIAPLRLKQFPAREKKKIVVLKRIAAEFEEGRRYGEREVNDILGAIYEDYASLRRYLIEYGYLERTTDCKEYWLHE